MDCGRLKSGIRWSSHSFTSNPCVPSVVIEDCDSEQSDRSAGNNNYLITYPEEESDIGDIDSVFLNKQLKGVDSNSAAEPLFTSGEVLIGEVDEEREAGELMKSESKKFRDYKFCEAVNDFDIELEGGEAVPIVYLSTTRAAKLQRALRLAGLKKVCLFFFCSPYYFAEQFLTF